MQKQMKLDAVAFGFGGPIVAPAKVSSSSDAKKSVKIADRELRRFAEALRELLRLGEGYSEGVIRSTSESW